MKAASKAVVDHHHRLAFSRIWGDGSLSSSKLDKETDYGPLEPLFRGTIDVALICEQWDQLARIAASLKERTAPAHVVLQRLINASPPIGSPRP